MTKQSVIVVDEFREIVNSLPLFSVNGASIPVSFMHGHPEEIEANLIEITQLQGYNGMVKYPLIALFQDFPEEMGDAGGYYGRVTIPKIIIATITDNTYKSEQRYNATFKPVLYPIYYAFMDKIAKHRGFIVADVASIRHTKIDRLYYGTQYAGQGLNDYVDAIEISNLQLTLNRFCK